MIYILAFALFMWFGGYLMTTCFMSTTGVHGDELEKIITPPKWLYYACGAPISKKYPKGEMRVVAFGGQMLGIFWVLFVICAQILIPPGYINGIGLGVFTLASYLVTSFFSKRYASRNQDRIRKGRKSKNKK